MKDTGKAKYERNKKEIYDSIVSNIESAMDSNVTQVYLKGLIVMDEALDVVADSSTWKKAIARALEFYKESEDYESCAKCQKLMDKL